MAITKLTIEGKRFVLLPEADYKVMVTDAKNAAASARDLRRHLAPALKEADRGDFASFTSEDVIAERRAARSARNKRRKGA